MMHRVLLTLALTVALPTSAFAQAKVGTAGGQFLDLGVSARALGMGEVFTSIANDQTTLYYNPAGAALLTTSQGSFTGVILPAGIMYGYAALVVPTPSMGGAWGFSATVLDAGTMDYAPPSYPSGNGETFGARDVMVGVTYSRFLTDQFSVGVTAKYVGEFFDDQSAHAAAFDVGTYYDTRWQNIRLGLIFSNVGSDLKLINQTYALPVNFRFGISSDVISDANNKLTIGVEGGHPNDNLDKASIGAEYWLQDRLAIRAGYKFNYDSDSWSVGLGGKVPMGSSTIRIDYAFTPMNLAHGAGAFDGVNMAHRFTLGMTF